MMRRFLLLSLLYLLFVGLTGPVLANPFLVCDPPTAGEAVTGYRLTLNGQLIDVAVDQTGEYGFKFDLVAIQNGEYTVTAVARNAWGESESSLPFVFTKAGPLMPTGMSIVQD